MCLDLPCHVLSVDEPSSTATVDSRGVARQVSLVMLAMEGSPVEPGDWLLVNSGIAVRTLDPTDAAALVQEYEDFEEESP
jgi:hydrogenase assembly chaperone HypC/HupF